MRDKITKWADNALDELAFFLVRIWANWKYILSCVVLVPAVSAVYWILYCSAAYVYNGQPTPDWVWAGYLVILVLGGLGIVGLVLWGLFALADKFAARQDRRRRGYIRVAKDGSFYIERAEGKR